MNCSRFGLKPAKKARQDRRGCDSTYSEGVRQNSERPCLIFNEMPGTFCESHLLPFVHEDLERLANMVHLVLDFSRSGDQLRPVRGISQEPGGLVLCTALLQTHFFGDWAKIKTVVCCESGGWVYASFPLRLSLSSSHRRMSHLQCQRGRKKKGLRLVMM